MTSKKPSIGSGTSASAHSLTRPPSTRGLCRLFIYRPFVEHSYTATSYPLRGWVSAVPGSITGMRTSPRPSSRHPMLALTPGGGLPGPGAQALVPVTAQMHQVFASCPHVPLMRAVLGDLKAEATRLGDDQVTHHCGISWFTGTDVRMGLSYGADPGLALVFGPGDRWHLSLSEYHHHGRSGRRIPAELPELLAWVMTGWPAATRFLTYTVAGGQALHADIPTATTLAPALPLIPATAGA